MTAGLMPNALSSEPRPRDAEPRDAGASDAGASDAGASDAGALVEALAAVLATAQSADLAMRGLRIHAWVAVAAGPAFAVTLDCTRPAPSLQFGHAGPCHVLVYVDESVLSELLAAHSFHDLFRYFEDGRIRLQRGLFIMLRLVRDPPVPRDNAALRARLGAVMGAVMDAARQAPTAPLP